MIIDNLTSYEPDMAELIDTEEEILADRYNVSLKVARMIINDRSSIGVRQAALILGNVIGLLMASKNLPAMVNALAIATGLDQLNGAKSEKEIADELKISRALLSHYVVGWRDVLSNNEYQIDITKMRKNNDTREIYAEQAKNPLITKKREMYKKLRETNKQNNANANANQ
jgi:predicted transcriptional regulator